MFDINTLIKNKIYNNNHTAKEIDYIVNSFVKNQITNNQMTEWLKAIYKNGMSIDEATSYTNSIINSGEKVNFSNVDGYIVDKHSTGGIGDKVSLILGPILAACNCYVPMIVGRYLAHTGGTLDKLESIPGYNGLISNSQFKKIVKNVGISIIGQTDEICPADRKIYSLRGRTGTVASFPLICGSIMSKKIAEGISGLVLDIKRGNGAFIKDEKEANNLGEFLSLIGSKFGLDVKYINSDMSQPLGYSAGLLCEVKESMKALNGDGAKDLMNVVFHLGEIALGLAGQTNSNEKMYKVIEDGSAYEIFSKMIYEHGGDLKKIKTNPKKSFDVVSKKEGCLKYVDMKKIGNAVNYLTILNGKIDVNAGFEFFKKNGDYIRTSDVIFRIHSDDLDNISICKTMIKDSYEINSNL